MLLLIGEGAGSVGWRRSGRRSGTRKRDRDREPSLKGPVRANAKETLESVALENHLKPSSLYVGPSSCWVSVGVAIVSVCETSDPPGRCC